MTNRLVTIPHDSALWPKTLSNVFGHDLPRSFKANDFYVIWKPICDFL